MATENSNRSVQRFFH